MCLFLCGNRCTRLPKCLFFLTNLAIMFGALLMVVVYIFVVDLARYGKKGEGVIFLVINCLAFFIAIIGIEATFYEKKFIGFNLYIIVMPIIATGNLILMFIAFNEDFPDDAFAQNLGKILNNFVLSRMFDVVYYKHECCGFNGPQDFTDAGLSIPLSCMNYTDGCLNALKDPFRKLVDNLIAVIWGNIIVECIGVFLCFWVGCMMKD